MSEIRQAAHKGLRKILLDPIVAIVALTFWGVFKLLPVRLASNLGGAIGSACGIFMRRRNKIAMQNLKWAFPEKTPAEHAEILRKMWAHWGRFYAEMPHGKELYRTATVEGLEHLKQAATTGKGGFVCSAHLGNWELAVSAPLFDNFYLNPVYRPANNPWLDKLMFQRRKGTLIPKGPGGAKKLLEVLKSGGFVVMLCDQKLREGISVPFFGRPAQTPSAIATMALKMNLPILMARTIRQPDGRFRVTVFPPLPVPKTTDRHQAEYEIMLQINQCLESWIRANPEQWLWVHRRFPKSEYPL